MKRDKAPVVRTVNTAIVLSGRTRVVSLLRLKSPPRPDVWTSTFYDAGLRGLQGRRRPRPNGHDRDA